MVNRMFALVRYILAREASTLGCVRKFGSVLSGKSFAVCPLRLAMA